MLKGVVLVESFKIDNEKLNVRHTISGVGEKEKFSFVVERLKDGGTYKEVICIRAFYGKDGSKDAYTEKSKSYMGKAVGSINKIEDTIKKLSEIGIVMSINDCRDLGKIIEKNYYNFEINYQEGIENDVPEKVVSNVLEHFAKYIKDKEIKAENGLYSIPVEIFKKEYEECTFSIPIMKVKEALRLKGYTKCNTNRNDYNIKTEENGKMISKKHISFYQDKIDKINSKKSKEENQAE